MRYFFILAITASMFFVGFHSTEKSPAPPTTAYQDNDANVGFQWAFGALVGKDKKFVSIGRDTVLKSGDEIKMMVQLTKDCFVYVWYYDANKEVQLLFPNGFRQFQNDYATEKNYYIPAGRTWSVLDKNLGKETFFLIASNERLLEIEATYGDYVSADTSKKSALAEKLVAEIRAVRKHYATFATLVEKPISIGGNVRGTDKIEEKRRHDVSEFATQIAAKNFYSKTFTIDHQ
jgi:hypothetical protein